MAEGDFRRVRDFLFGFPIAWVVVPALIGAAVSVLGLNAFAPARYCLLVAGIWLTGHWFCSTFLRAKFAGLPGWKKTVQSLKPYSEPVAWAISVLCVIVLLTGLGFWWVNSKETEYQQSDTYSKLDIQVWFPTDEVDPFASNFSVRNNGDFAISPKNRIVCFVRAAYWDRPEDEANIAGVYFSQDPDGAFRLSGGDILKREIPQRERIAANGDGETAECIGAFRRPPSGDIPNVRCVDVTVSFVYYLEAQPSVREEKDQRFFGYQKDAARFHWVPEPVDSNEDYCHTFRLR